MRPLWSLEPSSSSLYDISRQGGPKRGATTEPDRASPPRPSLFDYPARLVPMPVGATRLTVSRLLSSRTDFAAPLAPGRTTSIRRAIANPGVPRRVTMTSQLISGSDSPEPDDKSRHDKSPRNKSPRLDRTRHRQSRRLTSTSLPMPSPSASAQLDDVTCLANPVLFQMTPLAPSRSPQRSPGLPDSSNQTSAGQGSPGQTDSSSPAYASPRTATHPTWTCLNKPQRHALSHLLTSSQLVTTSHRSSRRAVTIPPDHARQVLAFPFRPTHRVGSGLLSSLPLDGPGRFVAIQSPSTNQLGPSPGLPAHDDTPRLLTSLQLVTTCHLSTHRAVAGLASSTTHLLLLRVIATLFDYSFRVRSHLRLATTLLNSRPAMTTSQLTSGLGYSWPPHPTLQSCAGQLPATSRVRPSPLRTIWHASSWPHRLQPLVATNLVVPAQAQAHHDWPSHGVPLRNPSAPDRPTERVRSSPTMATQLLTPYHLSPQQAMTTTQCPPLPRIALRPSFANRIGSLPLQAARHLYLPPLGSRHDDNPGRVGPALSRSFRHVSARPPSPGPNDSTSQPGPLHLSANRQASSAPLRFGHHDLPTPVMSPRTTTIRLVRPGLASSRLVPTCHVSTSPASAPAPATSRLHSSRLFPSPLDCPPLATPGLGAARRLPWSVHAISRRIDRATQCYSLRSWSTRRVHSGPDDPVRSSRFDRTTRVSSGQGDLPARLKTAHGEPNRRLSSNQHSSGLPDKAGRIPSPRTLTRPARITSCPIETLRLPYASRALPSRARSTILPVSPPTESPLVRSTPHLSTAPDKPTRPLTPERFGTHLASSTRRVTPGPVRCGTTLLGSDRLVCSPRSDSHPDCPRRPSCPAQIKSLHDCERRCLRAISPRW